MQAATQCFAEAGFAGATTRSVAEKAGVNVATLHYHFGNKESLYNSAWVEATREKLPEPGQPAALPHDRVTCLIQTILEYSAQRPALSRLSLFNLLEGAGPREAAPADPRIEALASAFESMNGECRQPPGLLARWLITLIDAAVVASEKAALNGSPVPADPIPVRAFLESTAFSLAALNTDPKEESER